MIKKISKALKPYKQHIKEFESKEKKGVVILDKKNKDATALIDKMVQETSTILKAYKKPSSELANIFKEALKDMIFSGGVGAVLVQQSKVVIRGDLHQESISDLIDKIFLNENKADEFVYNGIFEYLNKKVNIEFLAMDKLFNIKAIHSETLKDLIKFIKSNPKVEEKLKGGSIKITELSNKASKSYLKVKSISDELIDDGLKDERGIVFKSVADFLIRSIAKANATQLKYVNEFFNSLLKESRTRSSKLNFNVIRRNAVDREKFLKLIDDAKKKINEALEKENHFVKIAEDNKKKIEILQVEVDERVAEFDRVQKASKATFQEREVIRKKPNGARTPKYTELSTLIRELTIKKSEVEAELKKTRQKYELAKQAIENANDDRSDYMKLLPEMTGVHEKKISSHESSLKEFEADYLSAKKNIIELMYIVKKI